MSRRADARLSAAVAVAVILAAVSLAPVIDGWSWYPPTIAAVIIVVLVGAGVRAARWASPLGPVMQGAALIVLAIALVARDHLWGLLPTATSLDDLRIVLQDGLAQSASVAPPAPDTVELTALVLVGVGLVALVVDVVAVTLRAPASAGLPLLAIYLVPVSALPDSAPWWCFVPGAAGWLLLLTVDPEGVRRIRGGSALRIGAVTAAVAVLVPLLIPGLTEPLLGPRGGDGTGVGTGLSLSPLASLKRDYLDTTDREILTVTAASAKDPAPYLRLVTLDRFDGTAWSPTPLTPSPATELNAGMPPTVPGLTDDQAATRRDYTVRVGELNGPYLPLPAPAVRHSIGGGWFYDAASGTVFSERFNSRNTVYTVTTLDPSLGAAAMRQRAQSAVGMTPALSEVNVPASVQAQARAITDGTTNAFDRAVRLQQWFRSEFRYSTSVRSGSDTAYLEQFLTDRVGYCEQFAAAMAVMATSLGIPARVAVGFAPGQRTGAGRWSVSTHDAHAWPELWLPEIGWTRFEPTPRSDIGTTITTPAYAEDTTAELPTAPSASASRGPQTRPDRVPADVAPAPAEESGGVPVLLIVLVIAGLLAAIPGVVRSRRRRTRAQSAQQAWVDVRDSARDLGRTWRQADTPRESASRWGATLPPDSAAALERLSDGVESAVYQKTVVLDRAPADVHHDLVTVRRGMAQGLPLMTRLRAAVLPASVLRRKTTARRGDGSSGLRPGS